MVVLATWYVFAAQPPQTKAFESSGSSQPTRANLASDVFPSVFADAAMG